MSDQHVIEQPKARPVVACSDLLEHVAKQLEKSWAGYSKTTSSSEDSRTIEYASIKAEIMWEMQYAIRQAIKECSNSRISDS